MEWEKGQRRVAAAMMAEAEREGSFPRQRLRTRTCKNSTMTSYSHRDSSVANSDGGCGESVSASVESVPLKSRAARFAGLWEKRCAMA